MALRLCSVLRSLKLLVASEATKSCRGGNTILSHHRHYRQSSPFSSTDFTATTLSSLPLFSISCSPFPLLASHPASSSSSRSFHSATNRLDFRLASPLLGEPLKKKRKIDPLMQKKREEKALGKIHRAITRLERFADKLKPVDEFEVPRRLIKEREARTRTLEPLSFEESERRARILREFTPYTAELAAKDAAAIHRVQNSQTRALAELKKESESLYAAALALMDEAEFPLVSPIVTSTPPIQDYEAPDGSYVDVTKTFEYDVDVDSVIKAQIYDPNSKWAKKQAAKGDTGDDSDDEKSTKKKKKK